MSLFDQPARSGPPPIPTASGRSKALMITVGAVLALVVGLSLFSQFWTEKLWFDSVDHGSVFSTVIWMKIGLFLVFGLVMALAVGANIYLAHRFRPFLVPSLSADGMDRYRQGIAPIKGWLLAGVTVVLGIFTGVSAAGGWRTYALWRNAVPFGQKDDYFDKDIGWYVFSLPWWHFLVDFVMVVAAVALIAAAVVHYLYGGIRLQDKHDRLSGAAQVQFSVLLGVLVLAKAADYWLDRFDLMTRQGGVIDGMTYTGEHALWPAKNILLGIALVCALIFFANIWFRTWLLPSVGIGLMVLSAILLGMLWPATVQKFQVDPSVADKEAPYIQNNIDATRTAYGIDGTEVSRSDKATATDLAALSGATSSAPLLDPKWMRSAFEQEQQGYPYYSVGQVLDVDRYIVNGKQRAVVVGAREVDQEGLNEGDRNWSNLHTVYTHGDGIIAAYANQRDKDDKTQVTDGVAWAEGRQVGQKDLSSQFADYQSKIYFGELSPNYSIVGQKKGGTGYELSMRSGGQEAAEKTEAPTADSTSTADPSATASADPSAATSPTPTASATPGTDAETGEPIVKEDEDVVASTYDGAGGVKVGGLFNQLMFAIKFSEPKIVLGDRVHADSKILYNRNPRTMVEKVAPWLNVDKDPYAAIVDGRVTWIIDGYTATDRYPQSQIDSVDDMTDDALSQQQQQYAVLPTDEVNYMRNSVKATVDAYDGTVTLYEWDEQDPMLKAWSKVFPGTVEPRSEIPQALAEHLRYPEDLYKVQRHQLARYHETNQKDWFEGNNRWTVAEDPNSPETKQTPYRVFLNGEQQVTSATEGASTDTWSMASTFTRSGRDEMAAFLSVNSDAASDDYGQLRAIEMTDSSELGPKQIANKMLADERVAEVMRSYPTENFTRIHGNLITLPLKTGTLSIQPFYVTRKATTNAVPQLAQVMVLRKSESGEEQVGIAPTLVKAIGNMLGVEVPKDSTDPDKPPADGKPKTPREQVVQYLTQAQSYFEQAAEAQKAGDTLKYTELALKGQAAALKAAALKDELLAEK